MQTQERGQLDIEHLLFELNSCVDNLNRYRLEINSHDIQQAELSVSKLESIISFAKMSQKAQRPNID